MDGRGGVVLAGVAAGAGAAAVTLGAVARVQLGAALAAGPVPDRLVAAAVVLVGAGVAGWYALTAVVGLLARAGVATHALTRLLARSGAPALRRLAASTAAAGIGVGALTSGAAGTELPQDLGWGSSPAAAAPPSAGAAARTAGAAGDGEAYVVRPGDSLWAIAAAHLPADAEAADVAAAWPRWYAANRQVVGPDPDLIHPGQVLLAPTEEDEP